MRTTSSRDVVQIDSTKNISNSKEDDIRTVMDGLTIDSENVRHIKNKISYEGFNKTLGFIK